MMNVGGLFDLDGLWISPPFDVVKGTSTKKAIAYLPEDLTNTSIVIINIPDEYNYAAIVPILLTADFRINIDEVAIEYFWECVQNAACVR